MKVAVVIPARLESTRLPRKALLNETGMPLVYHTYTAAVTTGHDVFVATDNNEIRCAVESFNGRVIMTPPARSGTMRIASIHHQLDDYCAIVNWQMDEPELEPSLIVKLLCGLESANIATLATPCKLRSDLLSSNVVKVTLNRAGLAQYFSRSCIPWDDDDVEPNRILRHIGIYAYKPHILPILKSMRDGDTIQRSYDHESLEQLDWLYDGHAIGVTVVDNHYCAGIDTRADYNAFLLRYARRRMIL